MFPGLRDDIEDLRLRRRVLQSRLTVLAEEEDRLMAESGALDALISAHGSAVAMNHRKAVQADVKKAYDALDAADTNGKLELIKRLLNTVNSCLHVSRRLRNGHYIVTRRCPRDANHVCTSGRPQVLVDPDGTIYDRDNAFPLCNILMDAPTEWLEFDWAF